MLTIKKRDGGVEDFDIAKIENAIEKAFMAEHKFYNKDIIEMLALRTTADVPFWVTVSNRWEKLSRAMVITVKIRRKVSATKMFLAHTAMARCCRKILSSAIIFFSQHWSVNTELVFFLRWMIPQKLTRTMQHIGN